VTLKVREQGTEAKSPPPANNWPSRRRFAALKSSARLLTSAPHASVDRWSGILSC